MDFDNNNCFALCIAVVRGFELGDFEQIDSRNFISLSKSIVCLEILLTNHCIPNHPILISVISNSKYQI